MLVYYGWYDVAPKLLQQGNAYSVILWLLQSCDAILRIWSCTMTWIRSQSHSQQPPGNQQSWWREMYISWPAGEWLLPVTWLNWTQRGRLFCTNILLSIVFHWQIAPAACRLHAGSFSVDTCLQLSEWSFFYYRDGVSWWVFADKFVSSMETTKQSAGLKWSQGGFWCGTLFMADSTYHSPISQGRHSFPSLVAVSCPIWWTTLNNVSIMSSTQPHLWILHMRSSKQKAHCQIMA